MTFPAAPPDTVWACNTCSRWLTLENPQHGRRCAACIEAANREWDEIENPVAYHPQGHPTWCAGCGTETCFQDICWDCQGMSLGRPW